MTDFATGPVRRWHGNSERPQGNRLTQPLTLLAGQWEIREKKYNIQVSVFMNVVVRINKSLNSSLVTEKTGFAATMFRSV